MTEISDSASRVPRALPWPVPLRGASLAGALVLVATGLFFATAALMLDFGSLALPGPGFFPFVLGVALAGLSVAIAAELRHRPAETQNIEFGHRDLLITFAALVGICLFFERLGAYVTLGLFSWALLVLLARVPILRAALASIGGMVAIWYVFKILLGLQLPGGPF
jgi:hypothetical protein